MEVRLSVGLCVFRCVSQLFFELGQLASQRPFGHLLLLLLEPVDVNPVVAMVRSVR